MLHTQMSPPPPRPPPLALSLSLSLCISLCSLVDARYKFTDRQACTGAAALRLQLGNNG